MQITLQGQDITLDTNVVGYELDNLVDTITLVVTDAEGNPDTTTPAEQQPTYSMIVYMHLAKQYQTIEFSGAYPTLTTTLTSEQLPINGRYTGQLIMTLNDTVSHSEQFDFWVMDTLNPNDVIPDNSQV